MSLVGAIPGAALAFFGTMAGISGVSGLQMITYFAAAGVGAILAFLPVTIATNLWPKTGPGKPKAPKAAKAEKPAKGEKAAAVAEPASEELDIADVGDDEEFAPASDEFEAVSDDEFEFDDDFDDEKK